NQLFQSLRSVNQNNFTMQGLLGKASSNIHQFVIKFLRDTDLNMRVAVFKILFTWLIISLVAIHFAWKVYGNTVNDMYYRQGTGGQNGGTPDTLPHLSGWESAAGDAMKTHRE
uniref:T-cell leukemia translocation-altered gene protein homolog n=1 Tax=Cyprinus carpio TaxID=7962 RepID=A0A8C2JY40_CYPCA